MRTLQSSPILLMVYTILFLGFVINPELSHGDELFMTKNVNPVSNKKSYLDDFDDSNFRMKLYKLSAEDIIKNLNRKKTNLCRVARRNKGLEYATSSSYILSILKKAKSIKKDDKSYSFKSAHFFWENYLTYRNFVDVSRSFKNKKAEEVFSRLPEGYIILVESSCVENGAVALVCSSSKLFATRFPDFDNLKKKINNPGLAKCKFGKDLKIIVEAKRFLD